MMRTRLISLNDTPSRPDHQAATARSLDPDGRRRADDENPRRDATLSDCAPQRLRWCLLAFGTIIHFLMNLGRAQCACGAYRSSTSALRIRTPEADHATPLLEPNVIAFWGGTVAAMAEVVDTQDLTAPSQDGWAVDYRIRREDGEELHAAVRCWEKAQVAAERAANTEALAAIADRGIAAALEYADLVESPAMRGTVLISIWFDPADEGNLRRQVNYERALGSIDQDDESIQ
jgi:hypothetical protein